MKSQEPSDFAHLMTNMSVVAEATVLRATTESGVPQQVREKGKHAPVSITVKFYILRSAEKYTVIFKYNISYILKRYILLWS